jgi:hypothetical protein
MHSYSIVSGLEQSIVARSAVSISGLRVVLGVYNLNLNTHDARRVSSLSRRGRRRAVHARLSV